MDMDMEDEIEILCPLKFEHGHLRACSKNSCAWWMWTNKEKGEGCCAIPALAAGKF